MKSIHHGKAGANAKLNGKKTCSLSCGCCNLQNWTESERDKEADKEIRDLLFWNEEFISKQQPLDPEIRQALDEITFGNYI